MNFDFDNEQKLLRKSAADLLKDHSSLAKVRAVMEAGQPMDQALWQQISAQGWPAASIPEAYGGSGYGYLELVMLAQELGRAIAPVPFSSTIYLVAEAIKLGGDEALKKHWLPKIAAGEVIGAWADAEVGGKLSARFANGKLSGCKVPVHDGQAAHIAVVLAVDQAEQPTLVLVDLAANGVKREKVKGIDLTRSQSRFTFDNAPATPLAGGQTLYDRVLDHAAVLLAFEQMAGAEATMHMAQNYAKERFAFGQAIGGFQAIKHKIVDMFVAVELAKSNCYYAAWALAEQSPDLPLAAAVARVSATEAFENAARENLQVHGGIGFTWEADPHILFRRSKSLALQLGGISRWRERVMAGLDKRQAA